MVRKQIGMYSQVIYLSDWANEIVYATHTESLQREEQRKPHNVWGFLYRGTFWRGNFCCDDSGHLHVRASGTNSSLFGQIDLLT